MKSLKKEPHLYLRLPKQLGIHSITKEQQNKLMGGANPWLDDK